MVTLDRDTMNKLFHYVPGGTTNRWKRDVPYDEFWWTSAEDGEGYYMIWENGDTHHTYNRPDEIYS